MSDFPPIDGRQSKDVFPHHRATLIVMSILTLPYLLGLLVAILFSFSSLLLIDPSGTSQEPLVWVGFLAYCASPIPFIIAIFGGWLCFFLKRYRLTLILAMLPLIETILFVIAYAALTSFLQ